MSDQVTIKKLVVIEIFDLIKDLQKTGWSLSDETFRLAATGTFENIREVLTTCLNIKIEE